MEKSNQGGPKPKIPTSQVTSPKPVRVKGSKPAITPQVMSIHKKK